VNTQKIGESRLEYPEERNESFSEVGKNGTWPVLFIRNPETLQKP
jgi:hypothetical protein